MKIHELTPALDSNKAVKVYGSVQKQQDRIRRPQPECESGGGVRIGFEGGQMLSKNP